METGKKPCLWRNHISTNLTCGMVTFGFTVNAQHTKHHEAVGISWPPHHACHVERLQKNRFHHASVVFSSSVKIQYLICFNTEDMSNHQTNTTKYASLFVLTLQVIEFLCGLRI